MNDNVKNVIDFAKGRLKDMGGNIVTTLSSGVVQNVPVVSTDLPQLNVALGVKGFPKGRIVEVFGPESSGKTTLCYKAASVVQKAGGLAALVDAEHAFEPTWAETNGIDTDNLLISQPDCGEDALKVVDVLIEKCGVVIVDSVSALVPRAEIEGDYGDSHVGLQARLMSQAMRKLTSRVKKNNCVLIFINQTRMKIGVMFGDPTTTSGGNALKFYSSIRLNTNRLVGDKNKQKEQINSRIKVKVVKNKLAPPFKVCMLYVDFEKGLDKKLNLFSCLVNDGIIKKKGSWFSIGDQQIGQGKDASLEYFLGMDEEEITELEEQYYTSKVKVPEEELIAEMKKLKKELKGDISAEEKKRVETEINKIKAMLNG